MPELAVDGDDVVLRLGPFEKLGAFHGDVRVPRAAVQSVRVTEKPIKEIGGFRWPGTAWPKPLVALGTFRRSKARPDFVAVRGKRKVLVIDLDERSAKYGRLLVSVDDADETSRLLTTGS